MTDLLYCYPLVAVDIRLIVEIRRCQLYASFATVPEGVCFAALYGYTAVQAVFSLG